MHCSVSPGTWVKCGCGCSCKYPDHYPNPNLNPNPELNPKMVMVCNRSGAGNYHFRNLQMIVNDVRKAEKA